MALNFKLNESDGNLSEIYISVVKYVH
jgi:hypothetical protein